MDLEDDDLLGDDLDKGKKETGKQAPATNGDGNSNGKQAPAEAGQSSSAASAAGSGRSNGSSSKQAALDFIFQMHDFPKEGCNLLQDMELSDDDHVISDKEEQLDSMDDVVFSPGVDVVVQVPPPLLEISNINFPQLQKWGPVVATRKSSRVDIGDRAMMDIAMEKKKVNNLEINKNSMKGTILKNSFDSFNDHVFLNVASKVGVEIDPGWVDVAEAAKKADTSAKVLNSRL